jgi:predicted dienelactone hydrolase
MQKDWKDRAAIDPARIGFFGFSKDGYTGLVLTDATLDFQRTASYCIWLLRPTASFCPKP